MERRHLSLFFGFVTVAILGYWLAKSAAPPEEARKATSTPTGGPKMLTIKDEPMRKYERTNRPVSSYRGDEEATEAGALPGQRNIVFKDRAALEDFLRRAGDKVKILGQLEALNALRVGFLNPDDLAALLNGDEETSLIFPVDILPPAQNSAQAGAVELGAGLLDWLGITTDNSGWGTGVRIAILDTGVTQHPAFGSTINGVNMVDLPTDPSLQNGHGTAVASVIIGSNPMTPGVAPGSEIYSYRIANDLGQSDSFMLAQGIVAAVDGGAQLINISMASLGDSALVRNAIAYATAAGSLIVAAAGNDGYERVSYPAANDGVIAVGAVDALGDHMAFSNSGKQIAISAPGFGVNAAWSGDQAAKVNGTSFSSPIVVGSIAAIMTNSGPKQLTARQAADLLFSYLNDSGAEGSDSAIGFGMPDVGRVMNRSTRGIYDAAVASQRMLPATTSSPYGQMEVLVQNRGTETLINTSVQISTPSGMINTNITTLGVGATKTVVVPIPYSNTSSLRYGSSVSVSNGQSDSKPSNNQRAGNYAPLGSK